MSDRRHTGWLLAERLAAAEQQQAKIDEEKVRIYASARAIGLSRADLRLMAARVRADKSPARPS